MRERLIELIASMVCDDYSPTCDEWQPHDCGKCYANSCHIGDIADHLLANGVVVPPCELGDEINGEIVHEIDYFKSLMASGEIHITKKVYTCDKEDVRKMILCSHPITWEEAEAKLKGGIE